MWSLLISTALASSIAVVDDFSTPSSHGFKVSSILKEGKSKIIEVDISQGYEESLLKVKELKPEVLNLSLGGRELTDFEINLLTAISRQGTVIVVAAGNSNEELSMKNPIYPCVLRIKNLYCVGAKDNKTKAPLSNYGFQVNYFIDGSYNGQNMTSFAAPRLALVIAYLMDQGLNPSEYLNSLGEEIVVAKRKVQFIDYGLISEYRPKTIHDPF